MRIAGGGEHMVLSEEFEVPLGERLGPFIFWPVLALLLAVLVWAVLRNRRGTRGGTGSRGSGTRASGQQAAVSWTRPEDYAEHHRVVWGVPPESFVPTELHWPLAAAALLGICGGDPWDELRFRRLDDARSGLEEAWGIRSRPQLLSRLHWILREGHRVGFDEEVRVWSGSDDAELDRIARHMSGIGTDAAREQLWRLQQVRTNARGIREARFAAWDLVRAAMLARAGHSLGWLTEAEATDTLNLVSAELQRAYTGWADLGEQFARARWYWNAGSGMESRQEDAHDASRQSALLDPRRGPWAHVPWSSPIPASRLLLVDAMISEELLVEAPEVSPSSLAKLIDNMTDDRLETRR